MTIDELAEKLKTMRDSSASGENEAMMTLFGVIFAREIGDQSDTIAEKCGLASGNVIRFGINLTDYVDPRLQRAPAVALSATDPGRFPRSPPCARALTWAPGAIRAGRPSGLAEA